MFYNQKYQNIELILLYLQYNFKYYYVFNEYLS
jgi:hypothetical protein